MGIGPMPSGEGPEWANLNPGKPSISARVQMPDVIYRSTSECGRQPEPKGEDRDRAFQKH